MISWIVHSCVPLISRIYWCMKYTFYLSNIQRHETRNTKRELLDFNIDISCCFFCDILQFEVLLIYIDDNQ